MQLLADLDAAALAQDGVHHALEALFRTQRVYAAREHRTPEDVLSWIDAEFGGVWSSEAAAGGVWTASADASRVGFAAFDARGLKYHWLRAWQQRDGVGIFGPFGVTRAARRTGIGAVLLRAALFSLRERGYRQALIPAVGPDDLVAYYVRHAGARVVENVDLERRGRTWRATLLASGNGSNVQGVIDAARAGSVPLSVVSIVVNNPRAFALERAARAGIPASVVAWNRAAETREAYDGRLLAEVAATEPDVVVLLGWMHVLPATFVARFPEMLNLHPAFLPLDPLLDRVTMPDGSVIAAFRGARAFEAALAAGGGWSGATVHRVEVDVDRGRVFARAPLALLEGATREALEDALHALERRVVVTAIRRWGWEQP